MRPGTATAPYHRRLGCFFGYDRENIRYFIDSVPPRTPATDLVEAGTFEPADIAYATFVPELHEGSIDHYERAIEAGRTIRERVTTLAQTWEVPALETLATTVYEEALTDCSMT